MSLVPMLGRKARWSNRHLAASIVVLAALPGLESCGGKPKEAKTVAPVVLRDVPDVLRGTIGAEAAINGTQPQLVSGLGIVVNLNGTGGGDLQPSVATTMERELARNGVGRGSNAGGPLTGLSPQEFLRSTNVAVVIVEAKVPPGAPEGATFDVSVRALPNSTVTSLEGGILWSTDLRIGPATTFGGIKTRQVAVAKGPIYVNPFTEPSAGGDIGVTRTAGRVLGGGRMTEPLKLELVLDSDSHARARSVAAAINGRFPRGPGETGQTARGRGGEVGQKGNPEAGAAAGSRQSIAISVPRKYKDEAATFLELLRFTRVDPSYPEEFARRYVEELKTNAAMSEQLGWCLKAIGKTSVPFVAAMYDFPELFPRLTALDVGAYLDDARAVPHLVQLARSGTPSVKTQAIKLMTDMPPNPQINLALREFVNSPELDVRVAAWEGLSKRNDPSISRELIGPDKGEPKFILETVAADEPMIYVTQQGEPKIVIFGHEGGPKGSAGGLKVNKPSLVSAWSDRLMVAADTATSDLRLRYVNSRTNQTIQTKPPQDVTGFIEYLAHKPTPEDPGPGLDFTYSEVVGAVYEMTRQGGISAVFATEQDKLRAEIFEASQSTVLSDRPETSEAEDPNAPVAEATVFQPRTPASLKGVDSFKDVGGDWKPRIVPLSRPAPKPAKAE
jgi:hypothetical protein